MPLISSGGQDDSIISESGFFPQRRVLRCDGLGPSSCSSWCSWTGRDESSRRNGPSAWKFALRRRTVLPLLSMVIIPASRVMGLGRGGWAGRPGSWFGLGNGNVSIRGSSVSSHDRRVVKELGGEYFLGPPEGKFNRGGHRNAIPGTTCDGRPGYVILAFGCVLGYKTAGRPGRGPT